MNKINNFFVFKIVSSRFIAVFCYYGLVLLTTVLYTSGDLCHGSDLIHNTTIISTNATETLCRPLTKTDYTDFILTSFAEFPGFYFDIKII